MCSRSRGSEQTTRRAPVHKRRFRVLPAERDTALLTTAEKQANRYAPRRGACGRDSKEEEEEEEEEEVHPAPG